MHHVLLCFVPFSLCALSSPGCRDEIAAEIKAAVATIDADDTGISTAALESLHDKDPSKVAEVLFSLYGQGGDVATRVRVLRAALFLWKFCFPVDPDGQVGELARRAISDTDPRVVRDAAQLLILEDTPAARQAVLKRVMATTDEGLLHDLLWYSATHPTRRRDGERPPKAKREDGWFLRSQQELNEVVAAVLRKPYPQEGDASDRGLWLVRKRAAIYACREFALPGVRHIPKALEGHLVQLAVEHHELASGVMRYMVKVRAKSMADAVRADLKSLDLNRSAIPARAALLAFDRYAPAQGQFFHDILFGSFVDEPSSHAQMVPLWEDGVWWLTYVAIETGDASLLQAVWDDHVSRLSAAHRARLLLALCEASTKKPVFGLAFVGRFGDGELRRVFQESQELRRSVLELQREFVYGKAFTDTKHGDEFEGTVRRVSRLAAEPPPRQAD